MGKLYKKIVRNQDNISIQWGVTNRNFRRESDYTTIINTKTKIFPEIYDREHMRCIRILEEYLPFFRAYFWSKQVRAITEKSVPI